MVFKKMILIIIIITMGLFAGCTTQQYSNSNLYMNKNLTFETGSSEISSSGSDYFAFSWVISNNTFEIKNQGNKIAKNVIVQVDMISPIEKTAILSSCPKIKNLVQMGNIEPMNSAKGYYYVKTYPSAMCNYRLVPTIFSE